MLVHLTYEHVEDNLCAACTAQVAMQMLGGILKTFSMKTFSMQTFSMQTFSMQMLGGWLFRNFEDFLRHPTESHTVVSLSVVNPSLTFWSMLHNSSACNALYSLQSAQTTMQIFFRLWSHQHQHQSQCCCAEHRFSKPVSCCSWKAFYHQQIVSDRYLIPDPIMFNNHWVFWYWVKIQESSFLAESWCLLECCMLRLSWPVGLLHLQGFVSCHQGNKAKQSKAKQNKTKQSKTFIIPSSKSACIAEDDTNTHKCHKHTYIHTVYYTNIHIYTMCITHTYMPYCRGL